MEDQAHSSFLDSPELWVAVAFVILIAAIAKTAWTKIGAGLDDRAARIKAEIDEAQRLREEAQHLLAEFQRKQRDAAKEAEEILNHAKDEAARLREKAAGDLETAVARREAQAKDRIAQTEAQAVAEVRAAAVDLAVAAAGKLLAETLDAEKANALIDDSVREFDERLH